MIKSTFSACCFWGVETVFREPPGVAMLLSVKVTETETTIPTAKYAPTRPATPRSFLLDMINIGSPMNSS